MTILVRGTAHLVVSGLCKTFSFILLCEHIYFAYVYWNFASSKLVVEEFGVTDVDRRLASRTARASAAGKVILACVKGLGVQNFTNAAGLAWALLCQKHKTGEKLMIFFGLSAFLAGIQLVMNTKQKETGIRRLFIAGLVTVMCTLDIFMDTVTSHTGPGIKHTGYWE